MASVGFLTSLSIKIQLKLIVWQRNQIVHEADINPEYAGVLPWNIEDILVNEAIDFIEQVAEAIYHVVY